MKRLMLGTCVIVGMFIMVGLSGCKIKSASPDPNTILEMRPGETKLFKVEGPKNTQTTKCVWSVLRMNVADEYDPDFGNANKVLERANEFEFTVNPNGEQTNRIRIRCEYLSYEYGPDPYCMQWGCGYVFAWRQKDFRTWDIRILQNTLPVWNGNYYIESSRNVDLLKGYTTVTGSLIIRGNVQNLEGLDNLTSVGRNILIGGNATNTNAITSLSGLGNLTLVGGDLEIYDNPALTSLSDLENLTSVGNDLSIGGNYALTSLSGLENLTSVGRDLNIFDNFALTALGMTDLQKVDGDFKIISNPLLCTSLAEEFMNQVIAVGGIGGERNIEGNKECTTP